jgi:hypothetical protein
VLSVDCDISVRSDLDLVDLSLYFRPAFQIPSLFFLEDHTLSSLSRSDVSLPSNLGDKAGLVTFCS